MVRLAYRLDALGTVLAVAILGGCGAQSVTNAVPQGVMNAPSQGQHPRSWMKAGASKGDLLYVSAGHDKVYVYTYPDGKLAGTLKGFKMVSDLCSDSNGDVFVTDGSGEYSGKGWLLEYAHGGTSPIAKLTETQYVPEDCAVDSTTGNVAVANHFKDFALFIGGSGSPTYYSTAGVLPLVRFVTYDSSGNAYFSGDYRRQAALFPKGGSAVVPFKIQEPPPKGVGRDSGLGWDGTHLTDMSSCGNEILLYKPHGSVSGKRIGKVVLNKTGTCFPNRYALRPAEATNYPLVVAAPNENEILFYKYPQGGNPTKTIKGSGSPMFGAVLGVTISVAPSRE